MVYNNGGDIEKEVVVVVLNRFDPVGGESGLGIWYYILRCQSVIDL